MKKLGASVIALGAVTFVVTFAQEWKIEFTGVILALAGMSVRKGSRKGAIVALVGCMWMVLAAVVSATFLVRGYQEVSVWQGSAAIALGAWALVNAMFLARARPSLATGLESPTAASDGRPVLQFGIRTMLWMMLALAIVLGFYEWCAQRNAPPACATVQAIESRYWQQLTRLRAIAQGNAPPWTNDATNMKLFAANEILSVGFGPVSNGPTTNCTMTVKPDETHPTGSTWYFMPMSGIERPVTYLRYDRFADGKSRQVAIYENRLIGNDGPTRVLYRMELDADRLRSMADKEDSMAAGDQTR